MKNDEGLGKLLKNIPVHTYPLKIYIFIEFQLYAKD